MITAHRHRTAAVAATAALTVAVLLASCTDSYRPSASAGGWGGASTRATGAGAGGGGGGGLGGLDAAQCDLTCSNDLKSVVDCKGQVQTTCTADEGCANGACIDDPCKAAEVSKSSYGCDYWALKTAQRPQADGACFAAFVANTWGKPVHLRSRYAGQMLPVAAFTAIPRARGRASPTSLTTPPPGSPSGRWPSSSSRATTRAASVVDCPMPAGMHGIGVETGVPGTGVGSAFHITTDIPVVAYQMDPYGGGQAGVTSATLLLPTSAWDTNYIAVNAYPSAGAGRVHRRALPSLDILAYQDNTEVTILPKADIVGRARRASAAPAGDAGHVHAQRRAVPPDHADRRSSPAAPSSPTLPIGVFGASAGMAVPLGQADIDSAQQQIPPVRALGSEYVAVRVPRAAGGRAGRVGALAAGGRGRRHHAHVGAQGAPGAPSAINLGEVVEIRTPGPFVVKSQDADHPFYLGGYMTGGGATADGGARVRRRGRPRLGQRDHARAVPRPLRPVHGSRPTRRRTSCSSARPRKVDGSFADVTLDCAGDSAPQKVSGWQLHHFGEFHFHR